MKEEDLQRETAAYRVDSWLPGSAEALTARLMVSLVTPDATAIMFVFPGWRAVTKPEDDIAATLESELVHTTLEVRSLMNVINRSVYSPVAENCTSPPTAIATGPGLNEIDKSVGATVVGDGVVENTELHDVRPTASNSSPTHKHL